MSSLRTEIEEEIEPVTEKYCLKCDTTKPVTEFYKSKREKCGYHFYCKSCEKSYKQKYYAKNRDEVLRKQHEYNEKFAEERNEGRRLCTEKHKEQIAERMRRYNLENQEKKLAHRLVREAIISGDLIKQPCEECGKDAGVQAHHEDYSKPLQVNWLCCRHHLRLHGLSKRGDASLEEGKGE